MTGDRHGLVDLSADEDAEAQSPKAHPGCG